MALQGNFSKYIKKKTKNKKPSGLLSVVLHNILIPLKEEKEMTEDDRGWMASLTQ